MSPGAVDFIRGALNRDPAARPSIAQLLDHPWLLQYTKRRRDKLAAVRDSGQRVQRSKSDLATYQVRARGGGCLPACLKGSCHSVLVVKSVFAWLAIIGL
jgi:serine/threonine protein kinase